MKEFKREFFSRIHKLVILVDKEAARVLRERGGLTFSQFLILRVSESCGNAPQQLLARALGVSEASVSRQVKNLAKQKLAVLRINPKNRREHQFAPTRMGKEALAEAEAVLDKHFASLDVGIPEHEKKKLLKQLDTITERLLVSIKI